MKYVILADAQNVEPFIIPRQLYKINEEVIIERTIRLLKENGVSEIIITSHDPRFDDLGAIRYEPLSNNYDGKITNQHKNGYWLDAFTKELLKEPITFLFGDVYYSEEAIKTIIKNDTDSILFFCTDIKNGKHLKYIKHHDEPLGFKVIDYKLFKEHIEKLKTMWDKREILRHPIAWELYRSINGLDVNKHVLKGNYVAINDITCDIDNVDDVKMIEEVSKKVILKRKEDSMIIKALKTYTDNVLLRETENKTKVLRQGKEVEVVNGKIYPGDEYEVSLERGNQILNHPNNLATMIETLKKGTDVLETNNKPKKTVKRKPIKKK